MKNLNLNVNSNTVINQLDALYREFLKHELSKHNFHFIFCDSENVPTNGKQIYTMYKKALKNESAFYVFNGSNDQTFFSAETNLFYRAVHDIDHALHYELGLGTTSLKSELFLNCLLAKRAYNFVMGNYRNKQIALMLFSAVYNDTVGQALYYAEKKDFVKDQKSFTYNQINNCEVWAYSKKNMINVAHQSFIADLVFCGVDL